MTQPVDALKARLKNDKPVEGLVHRVAKYIEVTTDELRTAVEANPDHDVAKVYSRVVDAFANDLGHKHTVSAVDLQALLESKTVKVTTVIENGVEKELKSLETLPSFSDE